MPLAASCFIALRRRKVAEHVARPYRAVGRILRIIGELQPLLRCGDSFFRIARTHNLPAAQEKTQLFRQIRNSAPIRSLARARLVKRQFQICLRIAAGNQTQEIHFLRIAHGAFRTRRSETGE